MTEQTAARRNDDILAVATALRPWAWEDLSQKPRLVGNQGTRDRRDSRLDADRLLSSTEPAVLDALEAALIRAGRLTEDDDVEWCEERCYATTYSSPYVCGDKCKEPGPHTEHECVDGHHWPVEADDHHPKRFIRHITEWKVVEP